MIGNILEGWSTFSAINVEKILAKKSGPITRLGLRQLFECDVCKVSLAATSIKRHKKTVHGDSSIGKVWKCKSCSKSLQTKSRLLQHERSHTNMAKENELSCQECKYRSDNKDYLRDHQRKMHRAKDGMWMCINGSCAEKPKSFVNNRFQDTNTIMKAFLAPNARKALVLRRIWFATSTPFTKHRKVEVTEI